MDVKINVKRNISVKGIDEAICCLLKELKILFPGGFDNNAIRAHVFDDGYRDRNLTHLGELFEVILLTKDIRAKTSFKKELNFMVNKIRCGLMLVKIPDNGIKTWKVT